MNPFLVTYIATGLIALGLSILPMPEWAVSFRPDWLALILLYWNLQCPERFNLGSNWIFGLVLDLLLGSPLGQHPLALSFMGYLAIRLSKPFKLLPHVLQLLSITLILALYRGIIVWVAGVSGTIPSPTSAWLPLFASVLLWPWLYILLREATQACKTSRSG